MSAPPKVVYIKELHAQGEFFFPMDRLSEYFVLWKRETRTGSLYAVSWKEQPMMDYGETVNFMPFEARTHLTQGIWAEGMQLMGILSLIPAPIDMKWQLAEWETVLD